jgi:hypothetical protein
MNLHSCTIIRGVNGSDTDGKYFYRIRIRYHFSDPDTDTNRIFDGYRIRIGYRMDINTNMDIFWILNKNIICIIKKLYSIL